MEGGGQPSRRRKFAEFIIRSEEMQRLLAAEAIGRARAAAEIEKIRATAQRRMLAEIDEPVIERLDERTGTAAEPGCLLEDFHSQTVSASSFGGSQAGKAAADDGDRV